MAKDYGRSRIQRRNSSSSKKFLMVILAFLIGYLTASVFDFVSLSHWINNKLMAERHHSNENVKIATRKTALPKPKFEFYTLLANGRSAPSLPKMPEKLAVASTPSPSPLKLVPAPNMPTLENKVQVTQSPLKESYIIQVGSFKTQPEAERMKASLILKGFTVHIVSVAQAQSTWYRVIVGPYNTHADAQKAKLNFAQNERINGMIRKNG